MPDDFRVMNTLGVAQCRCGLHAEALSTLFCSAELASREGREEPVNLAFLAMDGPR